MGRRPATAIPRRLARRILQGPQPIPSPLTPYAAVAELFASGPVPLRNDADAERAEHRQLDLAVVIPWYPPGSGGHATIFNLVRELEALGHRCSIWLDDPEGRHAALSEATIGQELRTLFGGCAAEIHKGFAAWSGVDVVLATSWPTAYRAQLLPECRARAYLVQDHEPEFHPTSADAEWAAATYGAGLHCIAASRWLAELLRERYGAATTHFDLGVDHKTYHQLEGARHPERVLFYARASTERRAVPLGLLALAELHRRRPSTEIVLFGSGGRIDVPFPHRTLGRLEPSQLAAAYAEATAGMVLSMTNPSLVPQEMLACGLPCVDVERASTRVELAPSGAVELAAFDPGALADALERLLIDEALRERRRQAGIAWTATRTWAHAALQVEEGLRTALEAAAATPNE